MTRKGYIPHSTRDESFSRGTPARTLSPTALEYGVRHETPTIMPNEWYLVFRDEHGRRWRIDDVRSPERWTVRRRPIDPEATHRVFQSHDGARCWVRFTQVLVARLLVDHGPERCATDGKLLAHQLHAAVGTSHNGVRALLDRLGTPWHGPHARAAHY